jgi:hypothetical protein
VRRSSAAGTIAVVLFSMIFSGRQKIHSQVTIADRYGISRHWDVSVIRPTYRIPRLCPRGFAGNLTCRFEHVHTLLIAVTFLAHVARKIVIGRSVNAFELVGVRNLIKEIDGCCDGCSIFDGDCHRPDFGTDYSGYCRNILDVACVLRRACGSPVGISEAFIRITCKELFKTGGIVLSRLPAQQGQR